MNLMIIKRLLLSRKGSVLNTYSVMILCWFFFLFQGMPACNASVPASLSDSEIIYCRELQKQLVESSFSFRSVAAYVSSLLLGNLIKFVLLDKIPLFTNNLISFVDRRAKSQGKPRSEILKEIDDSLKTKIDLGWLQIKCLRSWLIRYADRCTSVKQVDPIYFLGYILVYQKLLKKHKVSVLSSLIMSGVGCDPVAMLLQAAYCHLLLSDNLTKVLKTYDSQRLPLFLKQAFEFFIHDLDKNTIHQKVEFAWKILDLIEAKLPHQ